MSTIIGELLNFKISLAVSTIALLLGVWSVTLYKTKFPANAPDLVKGWPLVGSWSYFSRRWEFFVESTALSQSKSGSFSFWVGSYPVVGLRGEQARKTFFESRDLGMTEAYQALYGGTPPRESSEGFDAGEHLVKRLSAMLKGSTLRDRLPKMLSDIRSEMDAIEATSSKTTEPFISIYKIIFRLTMRTFACNELADDPSQLDKLLKWYEILESCGDTALSIMFPRLWTPKKIRRTVAAIRLYMTMKGVMDDRQKNNRREDDSMQYMMDSGDSVRVVIETVLGALYAGLVNSGAAAAWTMVYLSSSEQKHWRDKVWAEINSVADRYAPDRSIPLRDRLMRIPISGWENEMPTIDLCLREVIRLTVRGTPFRLNKTSRDLKFDTTTGEVIPPKTYAVYAFSDIHHDPTVYRDPDSFDPGRYLPDRAEDTKVPHAYIGWGAGRHPCLGMRFAKLEVCLVVAFWMAYFDSEVVDVHGNPTIHLPTIDPNCHAAHLPTEKSFLSLGSRRG